MTSAKNKYILTHPLTGNYGGLLQAYASYSVIKKAGFRPHIYQYKPNDLPLGLKDYARYLRDHLNFILWKKGSAYTRWSRLMIAKKFLRGLRMFPETDLHKLDKHASFVVGSDQVWRAEFCRMMKSPAYYFLQFATPEQRRNSVAYSASFGIDEWEGTPEETDECKRLLKEFKAVSVREHSGVKICKEVFGVDAVQMPDPTLLLQPSDYENIIQKTRTWALPAPCIAAYILDKTNSISSLLEKSATKLEVPLQYLLPYASAPRKEERKSLSVAQWLRCIRDCDYFITDSFHGCVFAIIFNKPFVCLGNKGRGSARFDTLLGTFGLENRLVTNATPEIVKTILQTPIEWNRVNTIHDTERERGINFLKENLSE